MIPPYVKPFTCEFCPAVAGWYCERCANGLCAAHAEGHTCAPGA